MCDIGRCVCLVYLWFLCYVYNVCDVHVWCMYVWVCYMCGVYECFVVLGVVCVMYMW